MIPKALLDMTKNMVGKGGNTIELPAPQTLYDRILNAINRTGRPLLLVSAIAFFWWGIRDPQYFVTVMEAFAKTPEWIATAILLVISIFGTGRVINDFKRKNTVVQEIADSPEGSAGLSDRPTVEINIGGDERMFNNLNEESPENIEDAEEILAAEPENDAIEEWKKKSAAS